MKRSQRRIDAGALLMGSAIPALLLFGVFSTLPYPRMIGQWPLGIGNAEVAFYQHLLDVRSNANDSARTEVYRLEAVAGPDTGDAITDARWHTRRFVSGEFSDTVDVRRLRTVEGGWIVRFQKEDLFRTQRQIVLIPASVASIAAKYGELLANELDLIAPEVSFVRVVIGGGEGLYLKEERIDMGFLEKRRITDASLFTQGFAAGRPDHLFPFAQGDTFAAPVVRWKEWSAMEGQRPFATSVDEQAVAAWLLMMHLTGRRDLLLDEGPFIYRWTTGRIIPLFRSAREGAGDVKFRSPSGHFFSILARRPDFQERMHALRQHLLDEGWRLRERFAAMDNTWLPVLAQGGSLPMAQAEADRLKETLLARLSVAPDLDAFGPMGEVPPLGPFADAVEGPAFELEDALVMAQRLGGELIGDSIVLRRGKYIITDDLVLPVGTTLILEKSARIEIAPGKSVLVQGALITRGTGLNPVFIRPLREDSAYGTFAVSANNEVHCTLRGLRISGGSEARINGFQHTGMLSIHGSASTIMENCVIGTSHGEDALNIKRGRVAISDCVFEDGHADLVDLDYVRGEVRDCVFRNSLEDSNGDGLDVSGSHVLVRGCSFTRLLDKGMSVGEASDVLVMECAFTENRLGIAVKDLSIAYVGASSFTGNAMTFGVYRKKPIYGGGRLVLYTNEFNGNVRDREVDERSTVVTSERPDTKVWASFGLAP